MIMSTQEIHKLDIGGAIVADLSVTEAAERLEVSNSTIIRYIKSGYFPDAYRSNPHATRGAAWRIPEEDVEAFEEKRRATKKGN